MSRQRAVTLEAVARHAHLSRQSISNALNAPHRLAPDTLARALAAIDSLGYRPNQAARSLRTSSSQLIGCRIEPARDGINGAILDRFLHALCEAADRRGYNVLLFAAADDEREIDCYDDLLRRRAVDAFVLTATHQGDSRTRWLSERGLPFVTFGRPWGEPHPRHAWVDVDGAAGTAAAVDHLVEQGHRRVGFIGWPRGSGVGDDRHAGWVRGVRAHGLPERGMVVRGEDGVETGTRLATRLLHASEPPTALVCASDSLAIGALSATIAASRPEVALTGFDNTPVAAALGISSIAQPLIDAAEQCLELLVADKSSQEVHRLLTPGLVVRRQHNSSTQREPRSSDSARLRQPASQPAEGAHS